VSSKHCEALWTNTSQDMIFTTNLNKYSIVSQFNLNQTLQKSKSKKWLNIKKCSKRFYGFYFWSRHQISKCKIVIFYGTFI